MKCAISPASEKINILVNGDPAANGTVYDDPEVQEAVPMLGPDEGVDQRGRSASGDALLRRRFRARYNARGTRRRISTPIAPPPSQQFSSTDVMHDKTTPYDPARH